jgi:hypothetical protein
LVPAPGPQGAAQISIEIISFCPKNTRLAQKGDKTVDFLTGRFTVLGFEAQNWMFIAAVVIAIFVLFIWKTRDRR